MPNAENCSAAELEAAIKACPSFRSARRLEAIKALILGIARPLVIQLYSVTADTLRLWIRAFNLQGIDALTEKARTGRPPKIAPEHTERLKDLIHNPSKADQTHWTAKKFHGHLRHELHIEVGYRTVVRWLHDHQFVLRVPQPWPDRQDEQKRQQYREKLCVLLADPGVELWFQDEMGVEGDPRPRRRWAKRGSVVRVTHNGDHVRMNVCGMICPRTGQGFLLEFTHSDTEVFQVFLDEANAHVRTDRGRNLMICDNASWHKSKSLRWGRFEPFFLPPYSPDLNPIERLWLLIKAEWFSDFVAKNRQGLVDRLDMALNWAMNRAPANQKTCSIPR